ncbi:hypothetical protein [Streptomyces prasinus]|uniref:hypothetical protein n=1 Tax=Streptomyces prasinus TaxID=67345 RepID=UPI001F0B3B91|nr:hypothetical protein [Streptomyces prasinus]
MRARRVRRHVLELTLWTTRLAPLALDFGRWRARRHPGFTVPGQVWTYCRPGSSAGPGCLDDRRGHG